MSVFVPPAVALARVLKRSLGGDVIAKPFTSPRPSPLVAARNEVGGAVMVLSPVFVPTPYPSISEEIGED
jgi:hypothetical protein